MSKEMASIIAGPHTGSGDKASDLPPERKNWFSRNPTFDSTLSLGNNENESSI